jgi:hypothetical protein
MGGLALFLFESLAVGCGRIGYDEMAAAPTGNAGRDAESDVEADTAAQEDSNDESSDGQPMDAGCSGDACPACNSTAECTCAFFAGHAYLFCSTVITWSDAESRCEAGGMRLARVDDATENTWIRASADGLGITYAWLGIEDPALTSAWQWADGTVFWMGGQSGIAVAGLYNNWNSAHPTGTTIRACGGLLSGQYDGQWDDRSCSLQVAYVCEAY